jgi:hypothetical protein
MKIPEKGTLPGIDAKKTGDMVIRRGKRRTDERSSI